ncbi:MAG: selenide, water dikinase SelD [Solirubrobacteraceae bacterium]
MATRLTSLSHGAGCGCKLPASALHPIIRGLPAIADPNVLVGAAAADDAAVYRLSDELALVQTVDFFTPIVDDPYDFGRIAATNALSDIYAMGARPILALNLVAFPLETLGGEVLEQIMRGAHDAVSLAGASIAGGHSIDDPEPKFGLAVSGLVHPDEILTNAGGRAGDVLVLSKPLGAGVVSTAVKRELAPAGLLARATAVMCELNGAAAVAARQAGAHALTDVTGFGLVGHLHELARASGLAAELDAESVPAIAGVVELLRAGADVVAGGTRRNRAYAETFTRFADDVGEPLRWLVCDAMTSGGLLAAVPPEAADTALGTVVGRLVDGTPGEIAVQLRAG